MPQPAVHARIETCPSPEEARQRIWSAGLFVNDEETSHIMDMVRPSQPGQDNRWDITDAWLAVDSQSGQDIGAALVSTNAFVDGPSPVLNLYVHADHQGRGIGAALLAKVLERFPDVYAHYTLDSVRLYDRAGVRPANMPQWYRPDDCLAHRRAMFVADLLQERAQLNYGAVQARTRMLGP